MYIKDWGKVDFLRRSGALIEYHTRFRVRVKRLVNIRKRACSYCTRIDTTVTHNDARETK